MAKTVESGIRREPERAALFFPSQPPDVRYSEKTGRENAMGRWSRASVRCYSGYKAAERPVSFRVHRDELKVVRIVESWHEPDHLCFRVRASDGASYILRHHRYQDFWEVRTFSDGAP